MRTATSSARIGTVPAYAFALAGSGKGDSYHWFQQALVPHASVIACRKWYENGDFIGKDWYCSGLRLCARRLGQRRFVSLVSTSSGTPCARDRLPQVV